MNGLCNLASRLLPIGRKSKNDQDLKIIRDDVIVKLFWRHHISTFKFSWWSNFHAMSMWLLVLELQQSLFIRDLTRNLEIEKTLSEFCPISRDWSKLGILNLAWVSLTLHKKWSFPLRICLVNVTKSAGNWRNLLK